MPLFLKNKILFIHIPKCGGTAFTNHLKMIGDEPFMFRPDRNITINRHTPQHSTWREYLSLGWPKDSDFKIIAFVRHPVERVISEYYYLKQFQPHVSEKFDDIEQFLNLFLSNEIDMLDLFDNHNLPQVEFLKNEDGCVDPRINIYPTNEINSTIESLKLPPLSEADNINSTGSFAREKQNQLFVDKEIDRIKAFYADDIQWFEHNFS